MQKKTSLVRDIIVVGFALFSMFFGAGNVIFPPYLGLESGSQWVSGFAAYFIADIGLAMLAMFALLRVGSSEAVVSPRGPDTRSGTDVRHYPVRGAHGGYSPHLRHYL